MTEAEWLAPDPLPRLINVLGGEAALRAQREQSWHRLLALLGGRATDRKLRLFAVAVCRRIAPGLLINAAWEGLEVAEKLADGGALPDELDIAREQLRAYLMNDTSYQPSKYAASAPLHCLDSDVKDAVRYAIPKAWYTSQPPRERVWVSDTVSRLRDIFGNPFRPVAFAPEWRTDTAVALARQMYESRDFGAMPILADALQDAGCDDADILYHCRADGVHVRGCWVVDLVLGKS